MLSARTSRGAGTEEEPVRDFPRAPNASSDGWPVKTGPKAQLGPQIAQRVGHLETFAPQTRNTPTLEVRADALNVRGGNALGW